MALTISGSGGGITREEVIALNDWQTINEIAYSFTLNSSGSGTLNSNQPFSELESEVIKYSTIRFRIKDLAVNMSQHASASSAPTLTIASGTTISSNNAQYKALANISGRINGTFDDLSLLLRLERVYVSSGTYYYFYWGADSTYSSMNPWQLYLIVNYARAVGTVSFSVVLEGKDPV